MKKKVFRERYNGEIKNGSHYHEMELVKDEKAGEIKIPAVEYKDEEVKPKKRGRKKSVKSDK